MSQITCPEFTSLGPEIIGDFEASLVESIDEVEFCIYKLGSCADPKLLSELFRAIHSLNGNCRMVLLSPFVNTTHELEEIVSEIRDGSRRYNQLYGNVLTNVVSILDKQIQSLIETKECCSDILDLVDEQIKRLRNAGPKSGIEDSAVVESVLSQLLKIQEYSEGEGELDTTLEQNNENLLVKPVHSKRKLCAQKNINLTFFKSLADRQDNLSIYRKDRTNEIMTLALALNDDLAQPVDPEQLSAAIYLHDFGMLFVPATILNKHESLDKEEVALIRKHIIPGCQLLLNIDGWQEAAEIVMQHHERFDGKGYPKGLKEKEIHPGATIVALADTYCAVTNERSDRSYKRTLFSAVTLINKESGLQFAPDFVERFNGVIRRLYINPA